MMTDKSVDNLIDKLIDTAHQFRLGREAQASSQFGECLNELEKILPTLNSRHSIQAMLLNMLTAQETHDWLGLADDLEYELPQLLQSKR
jgi:hypothetical protein